VPYVTQQLREVGIRLASEEMTITAGAVGRIGESPVEVAADGRALRALFVKDPFDCDRIVAFETADL